MGEIYLYQTMSGPLNYHWVWKNDLLLALKMFKAGKLKLFPTFGKPKAKKRAAEGLH